MSEKARIEVRTDDEELTEASPTAENQPADNLENSDKQSQSQSTDQPDLSDKLKESEERGQDYYDRLLRLSAEFDNYKKRTAREMRDVIKFANEKLIKELLTVVDNLERAIASVPEQHAAEDPLIKGVNLTLSEVMKILERQEVSPIQSLGQPFDPNFHQAMMQEETNDQPANTVVRELQKGYLIHGRLLRPALVSVSKGTPPAEKKTSNSDNPENNSE